MPSRADPGLFIKRFGSEGTVYVLVWVDDLIVGPCSLVATVHSAVRRAFDSVDLGPAKLFLGMELVRAKNRVALCQAGLIRSMLERFQLRDCRSVCTPLDPRTQLKKEGTPLTAEECGRYAEMVGCLLYVAVCTRPDIQFAASALVRYMSCPTRELMVQVFRCLAQWIL
jgi:hypothetical protein